jgi:hypothetical protein
MNEIARKGCHNQIIPTSISRLLDRGRRRIITQLGWAHLTTALGVVFGVTIFLLLFGTQILDWYWLPMVFLVGLGYGGWRMWQTAPTTYQVAQRIDRSLSLHDALSTAFHFGTTPDPAPDGVKAAQCDQAEQVARTVDLKAALPFALPRTAYVAGALALVALTMFGIRYGLTQSLDFKPSLVAMAFDNFFSGSDVVAKKEAKDPLRPKNSKDEFDKLGVQVNTADQKMSDLDPGHENASDIVDTPDVNADPGADAKSQSKLDPTQMKSEGDEAGQDKEGSDQGKGQESQPEAGDGKNDQQKDGNQDKNAQQKGDNGGLMDKLKDAMSNMLNKMKMQQKGQQQQQQQNAQKENQQGQQGQKSDQQGQKDQQGQQSAGDSKDQKADGKDGQQGQKSENAQGKSSEQKGNQQQSADAKSGMGKQDGSKDLKDAENQQAMGKISEIFGKRQQNLSGEVMIEVSSGKQQLKTAYSSKTASHKESGGEINRDEVPLIYQQYVEKYFDQIRKADAANEKAAGGGSQKEPVKVPVPVSTNPRPATGASQ